MLIIPDLQYAEMKMQSSFPRIKYLIDVFSIRFMPKKTTWESTGKQSQVAIQLETQVDGLDVAFFRPGMARAGMTGPVAPPICKQASP